MASRRILVRLLLCCAGVLGFVLAPADGSAQQATLSAADKETARSLMRSGDTKLAAGDAAGALGDYQAADSIMGVPTTRVAVSRAQEKLQQLVEARDTALTVSRMPVAPGEAPPIAKARAEAAERVRELVARIPALEIAVSGAPAAEVRVTVDGAEIRSDLLRVPRKVNPGKHQIVATAPGCEPASEEVTLGEGEVREVALVLRPLGPAAAPTSPAAASDAPTAHEPSAPTAADSSSGGLSPLVWVGFGVGAAGLVVGAVTGGIAASKAGDLKDSCPNDACPRSQTEDDYDTTFLLAHISTAGFVVAGVGTALGLVGLFALSDDGPEEAAWSVRPVLGAGALGVEGRF